MGAAAVLIAGMIAYALEHPRTAVAPAVQVVGTTTPTVPGAPADTESTGTFTLALNETGESHGWSVTPTEVIEDSRCPSDVQCIQAGTVRVRLTIGGDPKEEYELTLIEPLVIDGVRRITLLKVDPAPVSKVETKKSDYRFTFLVENL